MKKIKLFSILFIVFGIFSCTDLDEVPASQLSPDGFIKTPKDVETIIFGAYGRMANNGYWGRRLITTLMLRGDMVDIGNPGTPSRRIQINDFTMDATNGMISAFWPISFELVSAANSAIAGAESLEGVDESRRNELIGEAKFVRAFAYFMLIRCFGDVPYVGEAIADPLTLVDVSKTPTAEIYANIIADLEFGKANLPMTQNARSRASRGSAVAMLADVHLTLGNFSDAFNNAKWIIDNAAALDYALEPNFQDLYDATKQDATKEHIFAIDFKGLVRHTDGDDLTGAMTGIRGIDDIAGWGVMVPSMEVYNSFDTTDYRTPVSFDTEALVGGVLTNFADFPNEKRPHIAKYNRFPGEAQSSGRQSDNNYAVYRYAEILLIAAEAGNEISGPSGELEGYVNQIRERARNTDGTPSATPANVAPGLSQGAFRDMVLNERRIELAFEAKRWFDIQRRRLGPVVFAPGSLEPHDNFIDDFYLLPIPQFALDVSPGLLPQNPGY